MSPSSWLKNCQKQIKKKDYGENVQVYDGFSMFFIYIHVLLEILPSLKNMWKLDD